MRDSHRGLRMAMLTNNVREWEPLWRSMLPVDEIFELVVDSAFVGHAQARREIYELTLERQAEGIDAARLPVRRRHLVNVDAARALGIPPSTSRRNDRRSRRFAACWMRGD